MDGMGDELSRFSVDHEGYVICFDCKCAEIGPGGNLTEMVQQAEAHNRERHPRP